MSASLSWMESTPSTQPRFRQLGIIGHGAYGCVYKACFLGSSGKLVALKKMKPYDEKEGFPIATLREIRLIKTFEHPNIVQCYGTIVTKATVSNNFRGSTFLVMEYVETELGNVISKVKFDLPQIKCLLRQLFAGLDYLHSNDVVHRDLKTTNLLLNLRGELKIADFGLARPLISGADVRYTKNVVTMWYRAPEVFYGDRNYSEKIDIWAAGCIMVEMMSQKVLFQGREIKDTLEQIFRKLGNPDDEWPHIKTLPYWQELKPRTRYLPGRIKNFLSTLDVCCNKWPTAERLAFDDLLLSLLQYDPAKRSTAAAALAHPFLSDAPPPVFLRSLNWSELLHDVKVKHPRKPQVGSPRYSNRPDPRLWAFLRDQPSLLGKRDRPHSAFKD